MRHLCAGETVMTYTFITFVVCFFLYLTWESRQIAARRAQCAQVGHCWKPAGMGDDMRAEYICMHCRAEV